MKALSYLIRLEYQKLFKRRGTLITICTLVLFLLAIQFLALSGDFYFDGVKALSHYELMKMKHEASETFFLRPFDYALLSEAQSSINTIEGTTDSVENTTTDTELSESSPSGDRFEDYKKYCLPYQDIQILAYDMGINIYNDLPKDMLSYRNDYLKNYYQEGVKPEVLQNVLQKNQRLKQPFLYGWNRAYSVFLKSQQIVGFLTLITVAICLSGMFSSEHTSRMDALVLSSRYGKNKLILAKLLTGISFAAALSLCVSLLSFLVLGSIYGFEGATIAVQLVLPFIVTPMTSLMAVLLMSACSMLAAMISAAVIMLLSAKSQTPATTIILAFAFLLLPFMISMPSKYMRMNVLLDMLPTNLLSTYGTFHLFYQKVGGTILYGYQYVPFIYILFGTILLFFTYRSFSRYQVKN